MCVCVCVTIILTKAGANGGRLCHVKKDVREMILEHTHAYSKDRHRAAPGHTHTHIYDVIISA